MLTINSFRLSLLCSSLVVIHVFDFKTELPVD